jgi:hypothetical protein
VLRPLVRPLLLLPALLSLLIMLALWHGQQQGTDHAALAGLGPCAGQHPAALCWQGILPGTTTLAEARQRVLAAGYQAGIVNTTLHLEYFYADGLNPGCVKIGYRNGGSIATSLRLHCFTALTTGDVLRHLGPPQSVIYQYSTYGDTVYLTFAPDGWLNGLAMVVNTGWESVYSGVFAVDIFDGQQRRSRGTIRAAWQGLVPLWRYCQLQPVFPRCA